MKYTYEQLNDMAEQQIKRCVQILDAQAGLPPETITNQSHRLLVEAIISATLLSMSALQAEAQQQRHGAGEQK